MLRHRLTSLKTSWILSAIARCKCVQTIHASKCSEFARPARHKVTLNVSTWTNYEPAIASFYLGNFDPILTLPGREPASSRRGVPEHSGRVLPAHPTETGQQQGQGQREHWRAWAAQYTDRLWWWRVSTQALFRLIDTWYLAGVEVWNLGM